MKDNADGVRIRAAEDTGVGVCEGYTSGSSSTGIKVSTAIYEYIPQSTFIGE